MDAGGTHSGSVPLHGGPLRGWREAEAEGSSTAGGKTTALTQWQERPQLSPERAARCNFGAAVVKELGGLGRQSPCDTTLADKRVRGTAWQCRVNPDGGRRVHAPSALHCFTFSSFTAWPPGAPCAPAPASALATGQKGPCMADSRTRAAAAGVQVASSTDGRARRRRRARTPTAHTRYTGTGGVCCWVVARIDPGRGRRRAWQRSAAARPAPAGADATPAMAPLLLHVVISLALLVLQAPWRCYALKPHLVFFLADVRADAHDVQASIVQCTLTDCVASCRTTALQTSSISSRRICL